MKPADSNDAEHVGEVVVHPGLFIAHESVEQSLATAPEVCRISNPLRWEFGDPRPAFGVKNSASEFER